MFCLLHRLHYISLVLCLINALKVDFHTSIVNTLMSNFAEIWREYIGVEGIDLIPQLVIPNNYIDNNNAELLIDGDTTTCVNLDTCGSTGIFKPC